MALCGDEIVHAHVDLGEKWVRHVPGLDLNLLLRVHHVQLVHERVWIVNHFFEDCEKSFPYCRCVALADLRLTVADG